MHVLFSVDVDILNLTNRSVAMILTMFIAHRTHTAALCLRTHPPTMPSARLPFTTSLSYSTCSSTRTNKQATPGDKCLLPFDMVTSSETGGILTRLHPYMVT